MENYHLPTPKILTPINKSTILNAEEINANKQILQEILTEFNIDGRVTKYSTGPTVTQYIITLAPGISLTKITKLSPVIEERLKQSNIRVIAPIPGKKTVGIEVPNSQKENVFLSEIINSDIWQKNDEEIPIVLGKDVAGTPTILDLAKAPHLLIAGSTDSGKSVCINTLIMSMLFKFSPDDLQLMLIDTKDNFKNYKNLPHLVTPIIDNRIQASSTLRWVVNEMERRYQILAQVGMKNLKGFNNRIISRPEYDLAGNEIPQKLPYLVIIIDELADLMMTEAKVDVEYSISRIAAKGRAAGLHIVVATQRPSTSVITGVIKANLPTRIAFRVSSQVASRVILDKKGGETLLGKGDMLFLPTDSAKLVRIQGAMVKDDDIKKIVNFISDQKAKNCNDNTFNPNEQNLQKEFNWSKMSGKDILKTFEENPETIKICKWDEISDFEWIVVLKARPELADKCNWNKLPGWNQCRILMVHPELSKFADISNAEGRDIVNLLEKQPDINIKIPWDNLIGEDWSDLLSIKPQYIKHCNFDLLNEKDWRNLLLIEPKFGNRCNKWQDMTCSDWILLLESQPQFIDKYNPNFLSKSDHKRVVKALPCFENIFKEKETLLLPTTRSKKSKKMQLPIFLGHNESQKAIIYNLIDAPNILICGGSEDERMNLINSMIGHLTKNVDNSDLQIHILGTENKLDKFPYESIVNVKKYSNFNSFLKTTKLSVRNKEYSLIEEKCKNIEKWNQKDLYPKMNYEVVFVTDFFDSEIKFWKNIEENIEEICFKGCNVGTHLVIACSKMPSRVLRTSCLLKICFKMESEEKSKLCLGQSGAEKLTGNNDMLIHKYKSNIIEKAILN